MTKKAAHGKKNRKSSGNAVVLAIGLALSAILDPATKIKSEQIDSLKKQKTDPGRENE